MSSTTPSAGANPASRSDAIELAEAALDERQSTLVLFNERGTRGNRSRIAVDAEDARTRRGRQDGPAVAAGAEGGVNVGFARCRCERLQHLGKQHGNMANGPSRGVLGRAGAPRRHYSRAPPSPPLSP